MKLDELAKRIVNYLIVEELEIKFDKIIDDSRLYPKEGLIVINEKYKDNYIECAKSLAHEYRHVFQIYYANLMNDELAKIWREELHSVVTSGDTGYEMQLLEIDAFAFTQYYLENVEGIKTEHPNTIYQEIIEKFIKKYKGIL